MRDEGQKFVFHPVGLFSLAACLLFDFVETRLLDSQSDAACGHLQQPQIAFGKASRKQGAGVNHTDELSFNDQRSTDQRAGALTQSRVNRVYARGVFHNQWRAGCSDRTHDTFSEWDAKAYRFLLRS